MSLCCTNAYTNLIPVPEHLLLASDVIPHVSTLTHRVASRDSETPLRIWLPSQSIWCSCPTKSLLWGLDSTWLGYSKSTEVLISAHKCALVFRYTVQVLPLEATRDVERL